MSILPKAFYGFLILVMLASFVGSWQSLAKDHEQTWLPKFHEQDDDYGGNLWFESLTENTIRLFDSVVGKIICLALMIAASIGCGKLAFKYDYLYTGLLSLMFFAAFWVWIAIKLRFLAPFTPHIRM